MGVLEGRTALIAGSDFPVHPFFSKNIVQGKGPHERVHRVEFGKAFASHGPIEAFLF